MHTALALAGFEAKVIEMSWYGTETVAAAARRRLSLEAADLALVAGRRRAGRPAARWSHRRRLALAIALLRDPVFDLLLSGDSDFADLPSLMPRLAAAPAGALCHTLPL